MPTKNQGNTLRNTRNKSKNRNERQGALEADPISPNTSSERESSRSRSRDGKVPPHNQNKDGKPDTSTSVSQNSKINIPSSETVISSEHRVNEINTTTSSNEEAFERVSEQSPSLEITATTKMSDNREASIQTDFPPDFQSLFTKGSPIMGMFEQLKSITARLDKVDKIETTTTALAEHFKNVEERTSKLERSVSSNSAEIKEIKAEASTFRTKTKGDISSNSNKITDLEGEIKSLKEMVELQGSALAKMTNLKSDLFNHNKEVKSTLIKENQEFKSELIKRNKGVTEEMNKLLEKQKEQVSSFHATTQRVEKRILEKTENKIEEKVTQDISFKNLKDQAFASRKNLIITGLEENPEKSTRSMIGECFKSLGEEKVSVTEAYRIGAPRDDSSYNRPVKVKFSHIADRNKIWRKRMNTKSDDGSRSVKIQADLPKELRDEMNILYRITRAAAKTEKYRSASVRNYAISLHGREYSPRELEKLPLPLRPSTISNLKSEEALVFFSKYSLLSNHHPSPFTLQGENFAHMEQYLAVKKAQLSGKESLIQRASQASDPKVAKAILHSLRSDHSSEWDQQVEETTLEGLRANSHKINLYSTS